MLKSNSIGNRVRLVALPLFCLALLCVTFVPSARADEWNKKTIFTFTGDVQVPGKVLPAGTYVFKLLDSQSNRHIVQVFDKDEKHLITTILAVPDYRLEARGHTVIRFDERMASQPQAVKEWFYPGDLFGQEFVYPKGEALQVAQVNTTTTTEVAQLEPAPAPAPEVAPEPAGKEETPEPAPFVEQEQTPQAEKPAETTPAEPIKQPENMPKTGSELPLIALSGLFALGSAGLLSLRRR